MRITAVIPAYNEKPNIVQLTSKLQQVLASCCQKFDIIYVYEGSDGGERLLEDMMSEHDFLNVKYSQDPLGIGGALKEGFHMAPESSTHILTMDADLSHDPADIPKLVQASRTADIVIGSRYVDHGKFDQMPAAQKMISRLANAAVSRAFSVNAKDLSSDFRLYNKDSITHIRDRIKSNDYGFFPESLIVASRLGYEIAEVPITYHRRACGASKLNLLKTGRAYANLLLTHSAK